ncbi:MAG: primosomal protein N' [Chloroflexi bacterium RBG_16_72_14]|nr:MAG: primosomal protein N' [Chloroflexi bacterium RBG_16_72_14]
MHQDPDPRPIVEVAVDAPGGPGPRTYTYLVPPELADVEAGEPVLVPFGRGGRQAIGIVVGDTAASAAGTRRPVPAVLLDGAAPAAAELRPIVARIHADGPLLPPLSLRFAGRLAERYLAPLATVIRAMLPPGMLERLELVAEVTPAGEARLGAEAPGLMPADLDLLDELAGRARPVRDLATPEGRAALLRRLRALGDEGVVELTWTLLGAATGPRYERRLWVTDAGLDAARVLREGGRLAGRPLGPRQRAALDEMAGPAEVAAAVEGDAGHAPASPAAPGGGAGHPAAPLAEAHGAGALAGLVRRGLIRAEVRERPRRPLAGRPTPVRGARPPGASLTGDQVAAIGLVLAALEARDPTPVLLDGVTGGGKTAIYVEALAACLAAGRRAILLVPEIALATPITDRLRAELPVRIAMMHSGLGEGERADEWRRVRAGDADIVVGTRTALLAPLEDVGLVVVDEEHDPAYKSDRTPRFQARDAALELAAIAGAAVVLGSATPSVESVGHARAGRYRRAVLPTRPAGTEPRVTAVDLRAELAAGNRGLLSGALAGALAELDGGAGDRAILVINRRGTASVVLCRDCGHVQACPDCDRPLVYHQAGITLRCHHCGRAWPPATRCPGCGSPRIRYLGGGTERVEREVRERFPRLRVGRLDRDVVERRGAADRVLDAFADGRLDVLVGTSLVAKGLDVPEVTLVGVVSADVALNLPDERAAERTYQLLAQAVGRAGRGGRPGIAFIQTYRPEHRAIRAVVEGDATRFYDEELALRERFGSPPFGRLVKLTVALPDRDAAEREGLTMAERLRARAVEVGSGIVVAGPAPAYVARRGERWRYNLVLRGADPVSLLDPPPGAPWSVDVDPESLL